MLSQKPKVLDFPAIAPKFPGRFPAGHVNDVRGWNFSRQELLDAAKDGRMLTMDLDMTGRARCSLSCAHCFNPTRDLRKKGGLLSDLSVEDVVKEAKALGLRSVKIIGPGEPLEEKTLFPFLDLLRGLGIQPLIFTKATVLGNDSLSMRIHGLHSEEMALRLKRDYQATILFGANSFHPQTQAMIVGRDWYPAVRNRAMELLADIGFNDFIPGKPTGMALIFNPLMRHNIDEYFDVYTWARVRNLYPVGSPMMVAGPCSSEAFQKGANPSPEEFIRLYIRINVWAIEHGIYTLSDIETEGVSPYAGVQPCQQVGSGVFVRRDGVVLRCPGDDISILGRIQERSLSEIWRSSENLRVYGGMMNVGCPPKLGKTLPLSLFQEVLDGVRESLK